jgi:hypothetical protein
VGLLSSSSSSSSTTRQDTNAAFEDIAGEAVNVGAGGQLALPGAATLRVDTNRSTNTINLTDPGSFALAGRAIDVVGGTARDLSTTAIGAVERIADRSAEQSSATLARVTSELRQFAQQASSGDSGRLFQFGALAAVAAAAVFIFGRR